VNRPGRGTGESISRRQFIGGLFLAATGALLTACGGTATPTPVAMARAVVSATATTGASATANRADTTATPTTSAPAAVAAGGDFGRMLALVPNIAPLPGINGVGFADVVRQKRNYGFEGVTSLEAAKALDSITRLNNVLTALPLADEAGLIYALSPEWRDALGFDFWQVERTISSGDPPGIWSRLEGRFDRAAIAAALAKAGHQPVTYRDATILARGEDGQLVDLSQPLTRLTLARFNRVVLEDGALTTSPFTALAEAGIDARAGRIPSFAADPD
jgi:hypothetical protein